MKANNEKYSEINRLIEKYYIANQDNRNGYDKLAKELKRSEIFLLLIYWESNHASLFIMKHLIQMQENAFG